MALPLPSHRPRGLSSRAARTALGAGFEKEPLGHDGGEAYRRANQGACAWGCVNLGALPEQGGIVPAGMARLAPRGGSSLVAGLVICALGGVIAGYIPMLGCRTCVRCGHHLGCAQPIAGAATSPHVDAGGGRSSRGAGRHGAKRSRCLRWAGTWDGMGRAYRAADCRSRFRLRSLGAARSHSSASMPSSCSRWTPPLPT